VRAYLKRTRTLDEMMLKGRRVNPRFELPCHLRQKVLSVPSARLYKLIFPRKNL